MAEARRWIVIPVEVQVRELLSRLLAAALAAQRGYDVLLGHDRVVRRLAGHLPKGILFDKSLGAATERKVARYKRMGYTIAAIDEESTGFYPNPDLYLRTRLSQENLDLAERWFCLSRRLRDEAVCRYPADERKFVVTGLPRTDVWREQYHGLYERERSAIAAQHGEYLLFNSNFGSIIHTRAGAFTDHQSKKDDKAHSDAAAYREMRDRQGRQNLDAFLEMLPKLLQWFPGRKLIVRPHPSESREFWRDYVARHPGMEIHDSGVATPWILAASVLVHHGCTTGIEAELLGKPHVMYAPYPDHHHDSEVMKAFAPMVHDEGALKDILASILAGNRSAAKNREALEEFYASLVGPLVCERILDEFDQFPAAGGAKLAFWLPLLAYTPRHLFAQYWPRSRRAQEYSRQKWQGVSLAELRRLLAIIEQAGGMKSPVVADEIFPALFHIRAG
jgi:surface carbohydrate biosynthesis protein